MQISIEHKPHDQNIELDLGLCILVQVSRFHFRFMKKQLNEHITYNNFKG